MSTAIELLRKWREHMKKTSQAIPGSMGYVAFCHTCLGCGHKENTTIVEGLCSACRAEYDRVVNEKPAAVKIYHEQQQPDKPHSGSTTDLQARLLFVHDQARKIKQKEDEKGGDSSIGELAYLVSYLTQIVKRHLETGEQ